MVWQQTDCGAEKINLTIQKKESECDTLLFALLGWKAIETKKRRSWDAYDVAPDYPRLTMQNPTKVGMLRLWQRRNDRVIETPRVYRG